MIFKIDNAIISVSNGYIISINQTDSKTSLVLEATSMHRTLIDLPFADDKEKEFTELILAIFLNKNRRTPAGQYNDRLRRHLQ